MFAQEPVPKHVNIIHHLPTIVGQLFKASWTKLNKEIVHNTKRQSLGNKDVEFKYVDQKIKHIKSDNK